MSVDNYKDVQRSNITPLEQAYMSEFISGLYKAGSLISVLENKKINTSTLFALLIENPKYQDFFTEITASESFKQALLSMLYLHPSLVKSKITKSAIRKLNAKQSDSAREISVQQTPRNIKKAKK
jgi:hypothetical protein